MSLTVSISDRTPAARSPPFLIRRTTSFCGRARSAGWRARRRFVDLDRAVVDEARKGRPTRQRIGITSAVWIFAALLQLRIKPFAQSGEARRRLLLAYFSSSLGRRAADHCFDVIEFANAPQRLLGDRRRAGGGKIEELAPDMGETCGLDNRRGVALHFRLVEIAEPGIAVGVKNATKAFEMSLRMFALAIRL